MNFLCPFHNDKNASFSLKEKKFICYGCNLYGYTKKKFKIKKFELFFDKNIMNLAKKNLYIKKNFWLNYLIYRNINMITSIKFNLGYLDYSFNKSINKILINRLLFPILNEKNILESVGVRTTSLKNKYLIFSKSNNNLNLYGIEQIKNFNFVVIVEGYFDLLTLKKNFFNNTISILGSDINQYKIIYLLKKFKKIYFCFDGDYAGYKANEKVKKIFEKFKKRIFSKTLPYNYDPDNYINKFGIKSFLNYLKL
ncbi:toprim domain-containing protein [Candidatus Carsonella ruddii]|uniref:Toprim domain-containing protein n=1 Tax=Carsonella ruddii TaxID=114186 RepID=A0AAJ6K0Y6_CARRU|nr:toprim domain-containing protein [Candidatus Carsonella ruddii]WGS66735.1 toprim domain-containing protein [Candidatus Carsonella ruddii]WGS66929.1 toprim domain-containing protein [Candidatus Carsonella ruddii]WGS67121.1 toprim domain-containing protein [Candidatus Carsonella ruddii]WGS67313.1 toprim domain-containing protein [Candidatus Carsonella ruddii]WMC18331.1 MAG: toprim domain-containing protein [Candidatus Carsonella ruddii]